MTVPTGPEAGSRVKMPVLGLGGRGGWVVVVVVVVLVVVVLVVVVLVVDGGQCLWPFSSLPCGG
jgi:hypothetical protein